MRYRIALFLLAINIGLDCMAQLPKMILPTGHRGAVTSCTYTQNAAYILTSSIDNSLKLWNAKTGHLIHDIQNPDNKAFSSSAISPNGNYIAAGSADGKLRIYNGKTGKLVQLFEAHEDVILKVVFNNTGTQCITASKDRYCILIDMKKLKVVWKIQTTYWNSLATFSPDGKYVVTDSKKIKLIKASTGQVLHEYSSNGSYEQDVEFTSDSKYLYLAQPLRKIEVKTGEILDTLDSDSKSIRSSEIDTEGQRLLTCGNILDSVRLYDLQTNKKILNLTFESSNVIEAIFISQNRIVGAERKGAVRVWDANSGRTLQVLKEFNDNLGGITLSPDKKEFVVYTHGGKLQIFDAVSLREKLSLSGSSNLIFKFQHLPNNRIDFITEQHIVQWDMAQAKPMRTYAKTDKKIARVVYNEDFSLCAIPYGNNLSYGNNPTSIRIYITKTGELLNELYGHKGSVFALLFTKDNTLISGSNDNTIRIWNIQNGQVLRSANTGFSVTQLNMSIDENLLFATDWSNKIHIFDYESGEYLAYNPSHNSEIRSISMTSDGSACFSLDEGSRAVLWNFKSAIANLPNSISSKNTLVSNTSTDYKNPDWGFWNGALIRNSDSARLWKIPHATRHHGFLNNHNVFYSVVENKSMLGDDKLYLYTLNSFPKKFDLQNLQVKYTEHSVYTYSRNTYIEAYNKQDLSPINRTIPYATESLRISPSERYFAIQNNDTFRIWDNNANRLIFEDINLKKALFSKDYLHIKWNDENDHVVVTSKGHFNVLNLQTKTWKYDTSEAIIKEWNSKNNSSIQHTEYIKGLDQFMVYGNYSSMIAIGDSTVFANYTSPKLTKSNATNTFKCWILDAKILIEDQSTGNFIQSWNLENKNYIQDIHWLEGDSLVLCIFQDFCVLLSVNSNQVLSYLKPLNYYNKRKHLLDQQKGELISSNYGKTIIQDIYTGEIVDSLLIKIQSVEQIGINSDGRYISLETTNNVLTIYDRTSKKPIGEYLGVNGHYWTSHPDSIILTIGGYTKEYFLKTSINDAPKTIEHPRLWQAIPLINDSLLMLTAFDEGKLAIINAVEGRKVADINKRTKEYNSYRSFHPDELHFIESDKSISVFNTSTQKYSTRPFSQERNLSNTEDKYYRIYPSFVELWKGREKTEKLNITNVTHIATDSSCSLFAMCQGNSLSLYNSVTKKTLNVDFDEDTATKAWFLGSSKLFAVKHNFGLSVFNPDGQLLGKLNHKYDNTTKTLDNGMVVIFDGNKNILDTLNLLQTFSNSRIISKQSTKITGACLLPNSSEAITAEQNGEVYLWNLDKTTITKKLQTGLTDIFRLKLNEDSTLFAVTGIKNIEVYRVNNFEKVASLSGNTSAIQDIGFNSAHNQLMSLGTDHLIKVWDLKTSKVKYEMLNLDDNGFIIRLLDGSYYASQDAARKIYYLNNRNEPISFDQLDLIYNRPHKVLSEIVQLDPKLLNAYEKAFLKRKSKLNIPKKFDLNSFPTLEISNSEDISYEQKSGALKLDLTGYSKSSSMNRLHLWVNDNPIINSKISSISSFDTTIMVNLSDGINRIEVSVESANGYKSLKSPIIVNYESQSPSKLYYIGIATEEFADSAFNLDYSVKDIRDFADALKEKHGDNIEIDTLFNQNFTSENIGRIKQKLEQTKINDRVIISYSGHGLLDKDLNYYLSSYDVDFNNPQHGGIAYKELESLVKDIPARKKLMLIDACHSGEVDKDELMITAFIDTTSHLKLGNKGAAIANIDSSIGLENSFQLMQDLFVNLKEGTGTTIISAAGGNQFAYENGQLKNGVFTYSILELMNNKPDVTVMELKKYVIYRVDELTNGLQKPTSRAENKVFDWEL